MARKGKGKEAKLSYNGNLLVENRNGLIVNTEVFEANGTAERDIDARTTQHVGYAINQRKRKRIEECFGWLKTIALLRKVRHRGIFKVGWVFTFASAAYNLVRMRNLAILTM